MRFCPDDELLFGAIVITYSVAFAHTPRLAFPQLTLTKVSHTTAALDYDPL
jgi:hypothetical protein